MKCPNPKCKKKGELKTKRTVATGRTVSRERVCPACGERCTTVEMFYIDWKIDLNEKESKERELISLLNEKTNQLESLTYHFQQIFKICGAGEE